MQDDFLTIIGDYINGNESTSISVNEKILDLARIHQVEGIVFKQTKCESLRRNTYAAVMAYYARNSILSRIDQAFVNNGIEYFLVKGTKISELYPDPYLKTMGDSDITVHLSDKERASDILNSLGLQMSPKNKLSSYEWLFSKDNLIFELHHALLYGSELTDETENDEYIDYFSRCWDYVHNNELNADFHLLYLVVHLRKHFMNQGVGIRQFLDLAFFSKLPHDWEWIEGELEKLKLLDFSKKVFGLIGRWWNVSTPLTVHIDEEFFNHATELILAAGVFGQKRTEDNAHAINQMRHGKSKVSIYMEFFFPSYRVLANTSRYHFLYRRPYLLPVVWVYRAFTQVGEFKEKTKRLQVTKKQLDDRNLLYTEWGLISKDDK